MVEKMLRRITQIFGSLGIIGLLLIMILLPISFSIYSCIASKEASTEINMTRSDNPELKEEHKKRETLDGIITSGEYKYSADLFNDTTLIFYWTVENETLISAIVAKTEGWVSIGFKSTLGMKDADQIFGYVYDNGSVNVFDCYSTGQYGPHPIDESLGGTFDVLAFGGSEKNGTTLIEFQRNLTTQDEFDNDLESTGEFRIIWALGTKDEFHSTHARIGSGILDLTKGIEVEDESDAHGYHIHERETLDGVISDDEYEMDADLFGDGSYLIYWTLNDTKIHFAMTARTKGWVSFGVKPSKAMKDADMIFGWVDDGEVSIIDCYSTDFYGPHPEDTDLGGTIDILAYGGSEQGGWTTIEFERNITATDKYDHTLPTSGSFKIIWATGDKDEFHALHDRIGKGTLNLQTGEFTGGEIIILWPYHAALMLSSFFFIGTGIAIARFLKKKKWRLKAHKIFTVIGVSLGMAGLILGVIMVELSTGVHFRILHDIIGTISVLTFIITPILGFLIFKIKRKRKQIRFAHIWIGRFDIFLLVIISIILGFLSVYGIWE
jgi:hypothetical protein